MYCRKCGKLLNDDDVYCPKCGTKVETGADSEPAAENAVRVPAPQPKAASSPAAPVKAAPAPQQTKTAASPSSAPKAAPSPVPSAAKKTGPAKKKKSHVGVIIIAVVALALVTSGTLVMLQRNKAPQAYDKAAELFAAGDYAQAGEIFSQLGDYSDAAALSEYCSSRTNYDEAEKLFSEGKYKEAQELYKQVPGFEDSSEKEVLCRQYMDYNAAMESFDARQWEQAREKFLALGDFEDAQAKAQFCTGADEYYQALDEFNEHNYDAAAEMFGQFEPEFGDAQYYLEASNTLKEIETTIDDIENGNYSQYSSLPEIDDEIIQSNEEYSEKYEQWSDYYKAIELYNTGYYYQAMVLFNSLNGLADSDSLAAACPQRDPGTGELFHSSEFSGSEVSLTIVPPADESKNVIKIYSEGGSLVAMAFIAPGGRITFNLPAGTYTVKNGFSTGSWYGNEDMFGKGGDYKKMTIEGKEYITIETGFAYTLSLRTAKEGGTSVGSRYENWDDF